MAVRPCWILIGLVWVTLGKLYCASGPSAPGRALYVEEPFSVQGFPLAECKFLITALQLQRSRRVFVHNPRSSVWIMSRPFEKSKTLLREVKHGRRTLNHNNNNDRMRGREWKDNENDQQMLETTSWIPHPRTGIYYPKGHEWVMEDVPKGAASFRQAYWLRNSEGTDKPIADPSTSGLFEHPFLNM